MSNKKGLRFCFTLNNPGDFRPTYDAAHMAYMIFSLEKGESGTPHLQGYVRFKNRKSFNSAKNYISAECHIEAAKGSEEQNHDYCTKDPLAPPVEYGTYEPANGAKGQGARNDLTVALDKIKQGIPKEKVFMDHPGLVVKYPSGMEKAAEILMGPVPNQRQVHNTVLWGPTGTGKSHRVHTTFPDAYYATTGVGTFDRYSGESIVVLDEFEPMNVLITDLLQWMDKWKCQIKCRYANKYARWNHLVIMCNFHPDQWYPLAEPHQRLAVQRRLQPPMGMVYECLSQQQEINLLWFAPDPTPPPLSPTAPSSSTAPPVPAPLTSPPIAPIANLKRTLHPSPTSSPPLEPPLRRMTYSAQPLTSGAISTPASLLLGDDESAPIQIDDF